MILRDLKMITHMEMEILSKNCGLFIKSSEMKIKFISLALNSSNSTFKIFLLRQNLWL
jgi:hypothetical protein